VLDYDFLQNVIFLGCIKDLYSLRKSYVHNGLVLRLLQILLVINCLLNSVWAHVVTQISAEWSVTKTWEIQLLFDAGYAVPEWRDDEQAKSPRRDWLVALSDQEWGTMRCEAERYLRECLEVRSSGQATAWRVVFPDFEKTPPDFPSLLNDGAYFRVKILGEQSLQGLTEVHWRAGVRPPLILKVPSKRGGYVTITPGQSLSLPNTQQKIGHASWFEAFRQGFMHVIPLGFDHVLFVLGLFFYRREWRPLLWQSLAFTLAHTVTLGLAAAGIIRISSSWVEPMIALSIVVIALEDLLYVRGTSFRVRIAVVFSFGLVHGLGFAGALAIWLTPNGKFLVNLFSANLGVEVAQIAMLTSLWFITLGWNHSVNYQVLRKVCCLGIAGIGIFWFFERLGFVAIS